MLAVALCGLVAMSTPDWVDLRHTYDRYGLSVCQQNGPLCWDYTVIGLLEYELATQRKSASRLSPGFLSWAASATDHESNSGSNFGRACRGLERFGIAPLSLGGDPDGSGRGQVPNDETRAAAIGLGRIEVRWIRFWNNRDTLSEQQLQTMESEIAGGHPVAVGMRWPNHTTFTTADSFLLTVPEQADVFDGHCVALVGYAKDAGVPGGGAFLFRNSWGTGWGDRGYAWMPFALLKFCVNDALSVRMWPTLSPAGPGSFQFDATKLEVKDVTGPQPELQDMTPFGRIWRGKQQLFFKADHVGQQFALDVPVEKAGTYELRLVITRAQDYGKFKVAVDGSSPVSIDGSGPGYSRSGPLPCGKFQLGVGNHRVVLTVEGHDSASNGLYVGLDSLVLVPIPQSAPGN